MPEKTLTEKATHDATEDKHLWPAFDMLARENPRDVRPGSNPASPTGFQMGGTQNESGRV